MASNERCRCGRKNWTVPCIPLSGGPGAHCVPLNDQTSGYGPLLDAVAWGTTAQRAIPTATAAVARRPSNRAAPPTPTGEKPCRPVRALGRGWRAIRIGPSFSATAASLPEGFAASRGPRRPGPQLALRSGDLVHEGQDPLPAASRKADCGPPASSDRIGPGPVPGRWSRCWGTLSPRAIPRRRCRQAENGDRRGHAEDCRTTGAGARKRARRDDEHRRTPAVSIRGARAHRGRQLGSRPR